MKIHPVISVVHLEPAVEDPYGRPTAIPASSKKTVRQLIDRLLQRKRRRNPDTNQFHWYILIRWLGMPHKDRESWELEDDLRAQVPELLDTFLEGLRAI